MHNISGVVGVRNQYKVGLEQNDATRFLATQHLQGIASCKRLENFGAHTEQYDRCCQLYAGPILVDFFDIIYCCRETCHKTTMYLGASQWAENDK